MLLESTDSGHSYGLRCLPFLDTILPAFILQARVAKSMFILHKDLLCSSLFDVNPVDSADDSPFSHRYSDNLFLSHCNLSKRGKPGSLTMSTYAVFGATGNCGRSLIEVLLQSPSARINAYCRNSAKLTASMPDAVKTNRMQIFAGQIDDVELLTRCIRGCKAVFLTVSTNNNMPGCRVSQDLTVTLLSALETLKAEAHDKLPKIIVLSSASLEEKFCRDLPRWFHWVIVRANSYVYEDLRVQERMLRAQQDWVSSVFIKPGGLVIDKQRGHKLDLKNQETFLSYLDLAAAMVEAADEPDSRYDMQDVTVQNVAGSARFPAKLPIMVISGVLSHFFPSLYPYLPQLG